VIANPRLFDEAQEVRVGVLGNDHEVGGERNQLLHVPLLKQDRRDLPTTFEVRLVGPARRSEAAR
jgi:hypothetical protein